MTSRYISMYKKGAITAHHLIVQSILMINPLDAGLVLDDFPVDLLEQMLEYLRSYQSSPMISNYGPIPTINQVQAAGGWIENFRSHRQQQKEEAEARQEEQAQNFHRVIEKRPIVG